MKKTFLLILLSTILVFSLGCSKNSAESEEGITTETPTEQIKEPSLLEGSFESIFEKIYEISNIEMPKTMLTPLSKENETYFIGADDINYLEGLVSEPMMGSYAHSIVLLRLKDGADIEKAKMDIKAKVDPRKWICVGVEPENVVVDNFGSLIILIIDNESTTFHDAFLSLAK